MAITHTKVSAKADGGDTSLVLPSDWNSSHAVGSFNQILDAQTPITFTSPFINGVGLQDTYMQAAWQNKSNGTSASTDVVITADNGTDTTWYMDIGINGSNYSVGTWTISGPGDAYILNASGHMTVGTLTSGKGVDVHTGGSLLENLRMSFDDTHTTSMVPIVGGSGPGLAMLAGMFNQ